MIDFNMNPRQTEIIRLLKEDERIRVQDLASRLEVSQMTIRRDLDKLEEQGFLIRTHGGATPTGRLHFLEKAFPTSEVSANKIAIGKLAASLVQPKDTVMVDAGTTTLEVTRHLPHDKGIAVATVSLCVAQELYNTPIDVVILGGVLRKEFPGVFGPLAETVLNSLRVNVAFLGCDGADSEDGFYMSELQVSALEKGMLRIADRVVVVTESSKFHRRAFVRYAVPQEIDILVTDSGLPEKDIRNLEERGVQVLIAQEE